MKKRSLETEYNRIYKNLRRSVYGYVKRGISTSFFQLPKKPKRVTEASIRALQKKQAEWKYYTSQKLTDEEYKMLPKNISRAFKHNISELSRRSREKAKISSEFDAAIKKYRQDLEERIEEKNKYNEDYKKMVEEGYSIARIPDRVTNDALGLYIMAENVYNEATDALSRGDSSRNWWFVQYKAETAMNTFLDMGIHEYGTLYSFNIKHNNQGRTYSDISATLDTALYDSEQLDYEERFSKIIACMVGDPKHLTAEERKQYDEIRESLGFT